MCFMLIMLASCLLKNMFYCFYTKTHICDDDLLALLEAISVKTDINDTFISILVIICHRLSGMLNTKNTKNDNIYMKMT